MHVNLTPVNSRNIWHENQTEAQETRQHILDVALRLFSAGGIIHLAGRDCKAAGVTRGAIYWHFKDKSDLFSEIWEPSRIMVNWERA